MRDIVRAGIPTPCASVLEIGPLYRPFFGKSEADVIYVDHADTPALREKYKVGHGFDVNDIVEVDAVWGENTLLECAGRQVDYVIASHVIEHVPDLITWLKELRAVLKPTGEIRLVVPDKRFTFDYIRRETALQDVIDAYARRARRPLPTNIFDHVNYVTHVDTGEAWKGPLEAVTLQRRHSFEMAINLVQDVLSTENYHDVHCWVFTPRSFAALMLEAAQCGLLDLECIEFSDTPHNSLEFIVFVRPSINARAITKSWERMLETVSNAQEPLAIRIANLQRALEQKSAELLTAGAREAQLQKMLETAQAAAESAHSEVSTLKNSRSWKLTAPLRSLWSRVGVRRG